MKTTHFLKHWSFRTFITLVFLTSIGVFTTIHARASLPQHREQDASVTEMISYFALNGKQDITAQPCVNFTPTSFDDVAAQGDYIYLADQQCGLWVADFSEPTNLVLVGHVFNGIGGQAIQVSVQGNIVYVADRAAGILIIDVTNPVNPILLGSLETDGYAEALVVKGKYAYVATSYPNSGLEIVDISMPSNPHKIGFFQTYNYEYAVTVSGNYAYLAGQNLLYIIDISNPAFPSQVSINSLRLDQGNGLAIGSNYIFISWTKYGWTGSGLDVVDISDPLNPATVGQTFAPGSGKDVILAGNTAYFADGASGLRVMDVSNPTYPQTISVYPTEGQATGLALNEDYLYLASGEAGLYVFERDFSSVTGVVVDASGHPVSGVKVAASPVLASMTDAAGRYEFNYLPPGNYTFTPQSSEYVFEPPSQVVTVPPNISYQNFVRLAKPVSTILNPGVSTTLTFTNTQGLISTIFFPEGAVSEATKVTLTPATALNGGGMFFTGNAFDLVASRNNLPLPDFIFNQPVTVTLQYSDNDIAVITDENALALLWMVNTNWVDATQSCVPPSEYARQLSQNTMSVAICQSGKFGLYGPTNPVFLPTIVR